LVHIKPNIKKEEALTVGYNVTFLNDNSKGDLKEKGLASLEGHKADLEEFMESDDYDGLYEYGLSFDNKLQEHGYYCFLLSCGGPSSEIRFYGKSGNIEYVYLDWFCGVGFNVTDDRVFQWVRDYMVEVYTE